MTPEPFWGKYYFYPLLAFTTLIVFMVSIWHRHTTPGAMGPCDFEKSCGKHRFVIADNSWLCCEDAGAFTAAHIFHPLGLAVLTGWPGFFLWLVAYYETIEADTTSLFKTFVFVPDDFRNRETLTGSLIDDVQIQGSLGILLAISLMLFFNWRGLFHRCWETSWAINGKYVLLVIFYSIGILFSSFETETFPYGLIITLVYHYILCLIIIPWAIRETDMPFYNIVEGYWRVKYFWMICETVIALMVLVPRFLPNYYYQTWIVTYAFIFVFQGLYLIRYYNSRGVGHVVASRKSPM
jgi:hypothetical protein